MKKLNTNDKLGLLLCLGSLCCFLSFLVFEMQTAAYIACFLAGTGYGIFMYHFLENARKSDEISRGKR
jgi:hypothetical protein